MLLTDFLLFFLNPQKYPWGRWTNPQFFHLMHLHLHVFFQHLRRALNAALSALARATKRQQCLQLLRDGGGINLISCLASTSPGIFWEFDGIFHGFMPWLAFKRTILWHWMRARRKRRRCFWNWKFQIYCPVLPVLRICWIMLDREENSLQRFPQSMWQGLNTLNI